MGQGDGNGTVDRNHAESSSKPKPEPKPPRKPIATSSTMPLPDFEIISARFDAAARVVRIEVKRNLAVSQRVDEIYVSYILRGANNFPRYYGDWMVRRTEDPKDTDPPELDHTSIELAARCVEFKVSEAPDQPSGPSYGPLEKHWFDLEWRRKGGDAVRKKFFFFLALSR